MHCVEVLLWSLSRWLERLASILGIYRANLLSEDNHSEG